MRRAIVTGGAGFIGSHLVDRLLQDGVDVVVVDDLSSGSEANLPPSVVVERLDIANDDLGRVFRHWGPDAVFHLAAQSSVPRSVQDPLRDLAVNVVGTHRVAEAARAADARRLVFVSSGGAVYGETTVAAEEGGPTAPTSYYGIHKLAAEGHVALSRVSYAIVRPSNVFGARQSAGLEGAVVAAFLDGARGTGVLTIHGDGLQTRDFIAVRDVVAAIALVGEPDLPSGIWNVATGRSITILDLATIVERTVGDMGGRAIERRHGPTRPGDVRHSALSATRLAALGWRPEVTLESGIADLARASA